MSKIGVKCNGKEINTHRRLHERRAVRRLLLVDVRTNEKKRHKPTQVMKAHLGGELPLVRGVLVLVLVRRVLGVVRDERRLELALVRRVLVDLTLKRRLALRLRGELRLELRLVRRRRVEKRLGESSKMLGGASQIVSKIRVK